MSRVQLALNVDDIDQAVAFYSKLFAAEPAKRRPGYANFAIAEPPLKLVLLENPGQGGSLNHRGVEVGSTDEVVAATRRFMTEGLETRIEDGTTCCYALQDKVWVTGPGGEPWEVYTVLADSGAELEGKTRADVEATPAAPGASDTECCGTTESAASTTSKSSLVGVSASVDRPRSASTWATTGLTESFGSEPADRASTAPRA
jgi:catechol 2,3-dioxygenase-like lactoylglutathione lyase family enzyme